MAVIFCGDIHGGSSVAVCPPLVDMGEDGDYLAKGVQPWLLEQWYKFIGEVKQTPPPRVLLLTGDLTDGPRQHETYQSFGTAKVQRDTAVVLLQPLVNLCMVVYGVAGTKCHGGPSGSDDATVVKELGGGDIRYRWRLEIEGCLFDIAHTARRDTREHTLGNSALGLLRQARLRCARTGERTPDYIIRGHAHEADILTHNGMTAGLCPGWKLQDEYARRLDAASLPDIGGLIWEKSTGLRKVIYPPAPDPITTVHLS